MSPPSFTLWMNGSYVADREAKISIFDSGFTRGDAVFDAARTFGGKPHQLEEHLDRLFDSAQALRLEPALDKKGFLEIAHELVRRNQDAIAKAGDVWIDFRVTRGGGPLAPPTTIVLCDPIPFAARAPLYRDGIRLATPSVRRTPPSSLSPRVKSHNYLNFVLADLEVKGNAPGHWALLLDERGNLAEGSNSNIFLVRGSELLTPREQFVLPGISRSIVLRLGAELGLRVLETDLDLHDAYAADEVFLTSTSLCVCGVSHLNGRPVRLGAFGPTTKKLLNAYGKLVGLDIRKQYLDHLG